MTLYSAVIHWNPDPILFQIGSVRVAWYGLLFAAGFYFGNMLMSRIYKREGRQETELETLLVYMVAGTIIGARLGHCLFYDPKFYLSNPISILKIWEGGLASHGGATGIFLSIWLFCRGKGRPGYLWVLDRLTIPIALGCFFIRCGNFMNSEIVGTVTEMPWGIVFERFSEELGTMPRHPAQLYEAICYLITFIVIGFLYIKNNKRGEGFFIGLLLSLVFTARFFIEFVKRHQAAFIRDEALFSMGQYLSIPFIIAGIALIIMSYKKKNC